MGTKRGKTHLKEPKQQKLLFLAFPALFLLEEFIKDSLLVCELGRELGVPMVVANAAHVLYERGRASGLERRELGFAYYTLGKFIESQNRRKA